VKFEIAAHTAIPKGAGLEEIQQLWLDGLHKQFGDAVEIDELFKHEWSYIPHIVHTPFYCYAYNFGELLSLSLYARYKAEGKSFVPKIEAILAAGGSREPKAVLAELGINFESQDFWRGGFEIIKSWVGELKK
jgi:oligoendopeptidase F